MRESEINKTGLVGGKDEADKIRTLETISVVYIVAELRCLCE